MAKAHTWKTQPYLVEGPEVAIEDGKVLDSQHVIVLLIVVESLHPWVGISVRGTANKEGLLSSPTAHLARLKALM